MASTIEAFKQERAELIEFQDSARGREISPGVYRNFCARCDAWLTVTHEWARHKTDLVCDCCRPPIAVGGPLSNAFAPHHRID